MTGRLLVEKNLNYKSDSFPIKQTIPTHKFIENNTRTVLSPILIFASTLAVGFTASAKAGYKVKIFKIN